MRGRDKFKKFKPLIMFLVGIFSFLPFGLRLFFFRSCQNLMGKKGLVLRYVLLSTLAKKCGDNVSIHPNVFILNPQCLSLGSNVSIHPMCYIEALGEIKIGNNVSIAHGVTIMSTEHRYNDPDIAINNQGSYFSKVSIKSNVWIGAKATILAGICIGSGTVVGAGAVVTKDIKSNVIVGGVPAKVIKERI
ncbi:MULTISPECIES: acyltransferase [unclassified Bacillus (in: firmicutes)]|uniref:acyltransferase n=1 Tax=unclassified Bacillus (in: firmicutes) TaxID=185979 RepID=UPI0008E8F303|nr:MULTISPECIES: acyltransferase [unclassified Bacillus (in: firmicutes)]SFB04695.1 Acetyltransferase (isoleucine patch superfamily) [Bacillus sp. UNCCL13]SFQ88434.1 Acetyltransferase (isoleucine patch superfamily) [Bacillus sp. cl95]